MDDLGVPWGTPISGNLHMFGKSQCFMEEGAAFLRCQAADIFLSSAHSKTTLGVWQIVWNMSLRSNFLGPQMQSWSITRICLNILTISAFKGRFVLGSFHSNFLDSRVKHGEPLISTWFTLCSVGTYPEHIMFCKDAQRYQAGGLQIFGRRHAGAQGPGMSRAQGLIHSPHMSTPSETS